MSLVEIVWGSGMLVGGLILGLWKIKIRKVILINISYLVLGLYMLFSGLLPPQDFMIFVILTAIGGISAPFYSSPFTALLQTHIPSSALGRVFSLFGSLSLLPSMLGLLATGFIADSIGISRSFVWGGILILGLGILSFFIPSIMQLERKKKFKNSGGLPLC